MTDEKVILAQGTAMATRVGTLESATDFILQHDKTVEKFAKIEVLEQLKPMVFSAMCTEDVLDGIDSLIDRLKAGN